ncbi:MAG: translation initiation factor IF-2 subunit alpha [Candidatus Ranarchaeia archaeon]
MLRQKWPEIDELVIGTATKVTPHGAYIDLDQYGGHEGMIHISEISSSWVKNIRNHVKEGQKIVAKVLRIDQSKAQIDLSLRRVNKQQKRSRINEWKRAQKAEKLLEMAAKEIRSTVNMAYKEAGWKLEEKYGNILAGLERVNLDGEKALVDAGVKPRWVKSLTKLGKTYTTIPQVTISGIFDIKNNKSNGITLIKKVLQSGLDAAKGDKSIKCDLWSDGAPKYHIQLTADNYKEAEEVLKKVIDTVTQANQEVGGEVGFERTD